MASAQVLPAVSVSTVAASVSEHGDRRHRRCRARQVRKRGAQRRRCGRCRSTASGPREADARQRDAWVTMSTVRGVQPQTADVDRRVCIVAVVSDAVAESTDRAWVRDRVPSCRSLPQASPKADARQRDAEGEHCRRERQRAWRPMTPERPGAASPRTRRAAPVMHDAAAALRPARGMRTCISATPQASARSPHVHFFGGARHGRRGRRRARRPVKPEHRAAADGRREG